MKHKGQSLVIAILITLFFILVSTPWYFGFNYFAESSWFWVIHYVVGGVLALYVVWAFMRALEMLLNHEKEHIAGGHEHHLEGGEHE